MQNLSGLKNSAAFTDVQPQEGVKNIKPGDSLVVKTSIEVCSVDSNEAGKKHRVSDFFPDSMRNAGNQSLKDAAEQASMRILEFPPFGGHLNNSCLGVQNGKKTRPLSVSLLSTNGGVG